MEIVVKDGTRNLNVGRILREFMIRANEKEDVDFHDVNGDPFEINHFPDEEGFTQKLSAETVDTGRVKKVTLGFFMVSSASLHRIKLSVGFGWLGQQRIYLRIQRMPFKYGTDLYLMGYLTMEHPSVSNQAAVEGFIRDKWYNHMDCSVAEDTNDEEFLTQIQRLKDANLIIEDVLTLPISVERSTARVECPGKKSFDVPVLQVYVPRRYREAANYLNDRALLKTRTLKTLVPFSIAKNNPEAYYPQMVAHAKFLFDHRSITISSIPPTDYMSTVPDADINESLKSMTLQKALRSNKLITKVHENLENQIVTLSLTSATYEEGCKWIDTILRLYPYHPERVKASMNTSGSSLDGGSARGSKYASVFPASDDTNRTEDTSFDPSTIASSRASRSTAWNRGPPLNVTFNPNTTTKAVSINPDTQTRTFSTYAEALGGSEHSHSDNDSDTTPQSRTRSTTNDISALVEKALEQERHVLDIRFKDLESKQREFLEKVATWETTIKTMQQQIVEATVQGTMTVLTGTTSPFATKEEALQQQTKSSQDIQSLKEQVTTTNRTLAILQRSIESLVSRIQTIPSHLEDSSITSPPRKMRATELTAQNKDTPNIPADSTMQDMDGVRED